MIHKGWRRFKPHTLPLRQAEQMGREVDIYTRVEIRLGLVGIRKKLWRVRDPAELNNIADTAKSQAKSLDSQNVSLEIRAEAWLYALALQAPRAAKAQQEMDKHPHGYSDKNARLYELIDFNDTFVATVLTLPVGYADGFVEMAKQLMDKFCRQAAARCFSNQQYEAIVHGLSREIAVYRGAVEQGFAAEMTPRSVDALGVDMVISDTEKNIGVNIDVKTRSSYHYRLLDLMHEGRIDQWRVENGERQGFCPVVNEHDNGAVLVYLLRIDHAEIGEIRNFSFVDSSKLGDILRVIVDDALSSMDSADSGEYQTPSRHPR
ncbi:MAG: hypothetical protein WBB94_03580 [Candidatus Saccharimonadaceae bacterium]